MAALSESRATIRFFGENLDPEELSRMLGVSPTDSYKKGQSRVTSSGSVITYKRGMWRLEATDRKPEDLAAQIHELLQALPQSIELWHKLSSSHSVDLFCGLFMEETNEGFSLAPSTLHALAVRGISIDFDVYAPSVEESESSEKPGEA